MLALTKKTDYALIALAYLSSRSDCVASAREIAARYKMPQALLTNILKCLLRAGIVRSERGASGGYRLARDMKLINLHEMISAIEGPVRFVRCGSAEEGDEPNSCDLELCCPIRAPAHRIRDRLQKMLQEIPLSELMDDGAGLLASPRPVQLGTASDRKNRNGERRRYEGV